MGTLRDCKSIVRHKKIFVMDRNSGACHVVKRKEAIEHFICINGDRFIEQLKQHGDWVWIILERIPGQFKGGLFNERERLSADFNNHQVY